MKRIFVAGATGRVAAALLNELTAQGYEVTAGARRPEVFGTGKGIPPVKMDLHAGTDALQQLIEGVDAVYFVAGSRGKDLLQTDAFGAVKLMQAAEQAGVRRFILLSSVFATQPEKWDDPALAGITDYNIAKFFADQWLIRNTRLDYTIVQPGNLQEIPASGKIQTGVSHSIPNTIGNVAKVLAECLELDNTIKKVITMGDGETPIREALMSL